MSILVVASAHGSPGVSIAAFHLARVWPRPALLVEADLTGGDLLARFEGLDPAKGILPLAAGSRRGITDQMVYANTQHLVLLGDESGVEALLGPTDPKSAGAIAGAWGAIASTLGRDRDLVVDAGRLCPAVISGQDQLVSSADLAVIVLRPDLPGALHGRRLVGDLQTREVATVLVTVGDGFPSAEVEAAVGAEVVGHLDSLDWGPSPGLTGLRSRRSRARAKRIETAIRLGGSAERHLRALAARLASALEASRAPGGGPGSNTGASLASALEARREQVREPIGPVDRATPREMAVVGTGEARAR